MLQLRELGCLVVAEVGANCPFLNRPVEIRHGTRVVNQREIRNESLLIGSEVGVGVQRIEDRRLRNNYRQNHCGDGWVYLVYEVILRVQQAEVGY